MAGYGTKRGCAVSYWTAAGYVVPEGTSDAQIPQHASAALW
ncbi:hypothetical protein [Rhizobium grahamii]|nr:hypothetical protein [Rhizobium grahamii]